MNISTAIILAGGQGTRLRDVIGDHQKCMTQVNGKPFLFTLLDDLNIKQIKDVVIAVGYKSEEVINAVGTKYKNLNITFSVENEPLGTGGAIIQASNKVNQECFLVINGDTYASFDLEQLYSYHTKKKSDCTILLASPNDEKRYGNISIDENGKIISFSEKDGEATHWINAGVYLLNKSYLGQAKSGNISLENEVFTNNIDKAMFGYYSTNTIFIDIGTPESLKSSSKFFNDHMREINHDHL